MNTLSYLSEDTDYSFLTTSFDLHVVCFFSLPLFYFLSFSFMSAVVRIDLSEPLKSLLEASVWQALSPGGLPQVMGSEPAFPLWVFKCQCQ